ncbi:MULTISPECIES: ABC transporter substrate-binding protein [Streptomyces]|uniref:ABC transporter substrate-binding protein n=1 Tax=Streptomyces TaxID=1883 RepID=UPI000CD525B1|nr:MULTISPECIES: iron-siderophore ABC transporter substrate-binding protein [Streptomyces]
MRKLLRALASAGAAVALTVAATGCGGGSVGEATGTGNGDDGGSSGSGSGGVTLSTDRGEVTIDEPATKVVSLEWTYTEELIALGVQPVGNADNDGYRAWITAPGAELDEEVTDVGDRQAPSIEKIRQLEPDLIIADDDRAQANLEELRDIAPVLSFKYTTQPQLETMTGNFTEVARAVGREDQAEEVIGRIDTAADDLRSRLEEAGKDGLKYSVAQGFTANGTGTVRLLTDDALVPQVLNQAGMTNGWDGEPDEWGMTSVGVEGLTNLDDDVTLLTVASEDDSPFTGVFAGNPVWEGLEFVKEDRWLQLDPGTWLFGGPLSAVYVLEEAGKALNV